MTLRGLRRAAWAVWLGVAAFALNALVPIHAAFDLADALAAPSHATARSLAWHMLALAVGHDEPDTDADGDHHHHHHHPNHHNDCAVCSAAGTLAGFAATAAFLLPIPHPLEVSALLVTAVEAPDRAPAAAYRSRAPPLG
ncbi:MAG TPA: DUF2946 family protein [Stellaceae bacterium]|jgi:hypothetical protein